MLTRYPPGWIAGLLAGVLLATGASACGHVRAVTGPAPGDAPAGSAASEQSTTPTVTKVIPPGQRVRGDGDADNPGDIDGNGDSDVARVGGADGDNDNPTRASYAFPDRDDEETFAYGHTPAPAARRAIASVVERYFAAASTGDGATACSLLLSSIAAAAPADYGGTAGPPYLRGAKTCQAVMSMLFRHLHEELAAAITIFEVRVHGAHAQVILSSKTQPAGDVFLLRQGSSWKLIGLVSQPLP
jgi:hypothetical protein